VNTLWPDDGRWITVVCLLLLGGIVAVLYFVTTPKIARDWRVQKTGCIVALACLAFALGAKYEHYDPIFAVFGTAAVAYCLFFLIRDAWNRDRPPGP